MFDLMQYALIFYDVQLILARMPQRGEGIEERESLPEIALMHIEYGRGVAAHHLLLVFPRQRPNEFVQG